MIDRSDGHRPQEARWITEPGQKSGDRRIIGRRLAADTDKPVISRRAPDLSIRSASRQGAAVKEKPLLGAVTPGRKSRLPTAKDAQRFPDLIIFKGILKTTFVGFGSLYAGDWSCIATACRLRSANRVLVGGGRLGICHSFSPGVINQVVLERLPLPRSRMFDPGQ